MIKRSVGVVCLVCAMFFFGLVNAWAGKASGFILEGEHAYPNSVVEVATAVPAFIGYTEKAVHGNASLAGKPFRITSLPEYLSCFGGAPVPVFSLHEKGMGASDDGGEETAPDVEVVLNGKSFSLVQIAGRYLLYNSLLLYFENGGGPCWIVSVGGYTDSVEAEGLTQGLGALAGEEEPTLVVMPDAVLLDQAGCSAVQQAALRNCGEADRNRFAILDIHGGYKHSTDPSGDCIKAFRRGIGSDYLEFGAAYYPWLNTTAVQTRDLGFGNIAPLALFHRLLSDELAKAREPDSSADFSTLTSVINQVMDPSLTEKQKRLVTRTLMAESPLFNTLLGAMGDSVSLLPPSGAMAGVYTMVDASRGVWKAPANVGLNSVRSPAVAVTHDEQEALNAAAGGRAVNAIRSFVGDGTLVWGARTLDSNSPDWRYVNVRRTVMMLDASIGQFLKGCAFQPNSPDTWAAAKAIINTFLIDIWQQGGLVGASPGEAFRVQMGLGTTMTQGDVDAGIMRVVVQVAATRPAEFISINLRQRMGGASE